MWINYIWDGCQYRANYWLLPSIGRNGSARMSALANHGNTPYGVFTGIRVEFKMPQAASRIMYQMLKWKRPNVKQGMLLFSEGVYKDDAHYDPQIQHLNRRKSYATTGPNAAVLGARKKQ
jgi:hypothetical protein